MNVNMKRCAICGTEASEATCPMCGEASWLPANEPASNPDNYKQVEIEAMCDRFSNEVVTNAFANNEAVTNEESDNGVEEVFNQTQELRARATSAVLDKKSAKKRGKRRSK